jgi:hypothetical protein
MNVTRSESRTRLIICRSRLQIAVIKRKIVHELEARGAEINLREEDLKVAFIVCGPS